MVIPPVAAMRKLRVERLDLMQVHNLVDTQTHLATLRDWKAAGRVRYLGITHYHAGAHGDLDQLVRKGDIDFVQVNYSLAEPEDLAALVTGIELAREIVGAEPLRSAAGREIYPGAGVRDDADVEDFVRRNVELLYHPSGTCRMGGEDAVLDPELRVRGVEGLRVIDASVFPVIPGGNTNAPTNMVAERAADLVKGRVAAPAASALQMSPPVDMPPSVMIGT